MQFPAYQYDATDNFLYYEFISIGPKGNIRKAIKFTWVTKHIYNLGFGNVNIQDQTIDDFVVSDNKDAYKVMATVVFACLDFFSIYPTASIIIVGSTGARMRLYRMGINNNWTIFSQNFEIQGMKNIVWEPYDPQVNYYAFLINKK